MTDQSAIDIIVVAVEIFRRRLYREKKPTTTTTATANQNINNQQASLIEANCANKSSTREQNMIAVVKKTSLRAYFKRNNKTDY